jgi:flagellar protein FliS
MHTPAVAAGAYVRTEIQSRSPIELVVMLYDGANRCLSQAHDAIERQDGRAKREAISGALAIVMELQNNLDMEAGGEIAASLDSLYGFVNERLIDANRQDDSSAVDQAIRVLTPLREAWIQLARGSVGSAAGEPR